MITFEEKRKLAIEATELIKEFESISEPIREPSITEIIILENIEKNLISIECENLVFGNDTFKLSEIYEVFKDEMDGFGPCGAAFYDGILEATQYAEDTYGNVSKEEYIENIGQISYVEKRCEEIYDRLKKISKLCE